METGDSVDISGITATETYVGQYEITKTGNTTFTYTAAGSGSSSTTLSDAKVSPTFLLVPRGAFSQPKQLTSTRVDIDIDGEATATFPDLAAMNSIKVGDTLVIETTGSPSTFTVGTEVVVATRNDTTFKITFFLYNLRMLPM